MGPGLTFELRRAGLLAHDCENAFIEIRLHKHFDGHGGRKLAPPPRCVHNLGRCPMPRGSGTGSGASRSQNQIENEVPSTLGGGKGFVPFEAVAAAKISCLLSLFRRLCKLLRDAQRHGIAT